MQAKRIFCTDPKPHGRFQWPSSARLEGVQGVGPQLSAGWKPRFDFRNEYHTPQSRDRRVGTAPAGLNAFRISSGFPKTHDDTPLVLVFTVSDP